MLDSALNILNVSSSLNYLFQSVREISKLINISEAETGTHVMAGPHFSSRSILFSH